MAFSQLILGLHEPISPSLRSPPLLQEGVPKSPLLSPAFARRFPNQLMTPPPPRMVMLEFTSEDECLGRVVIKMLDGTGHLGPVFESLVRGCHGYGYRGSRVYACCRNEWCLMGDLLFDTPRSSFKKESKKDGRKENLATTIKPPTMYRGYGTVVESLECPQQDTIGSVVLIGSDLNISTNTWTLGPQFKICLSECLIKSGRVVGQVTEGLEVAQKVSQLFENSPRITISHCGSY